MLVHVGAGTGCVVNCVVDQPSGGLLEVIAVDRM